MKPASESQTSARNWTRIGWILSGLPSLFMLLDGMAKAIKPAVVADEVVRLGLPASATVPFALLMLACTILYLIPRTVVLGAILLTGYLGGALAIQVRVSGSGTFLHLLPVILGALLWGGIWLRDERLRRLLPLRA